MNDTRFCLKQASSNIVEFYIDQYLLTRKDISKFSPPQTSIPSS